MTITYRSVKGANLTPTEVDNNFLDLDGRLASLEGSGGLAGLSISNVVVSGNEVTFYREDGESWGPYVMSPVRFDWRGEWVAATAYYSNDVITNGGVTYLVLRSHTSAATFDPAAVNGSSQQLYAVMVYGLPTGGTTGQVLTKLSGTDYDVAWIDSGGAGSGSGGGGGGSSLYDGAILYMSADQVDADGVEVEFDTEETGSVYAPDWVEPHTSGGWPARLLVKEDCMAEVGFRVTLTATDAGALYEAYITRATFSSSPYAGALPQQCCYDPGRGYITITASTTVWLPAGLQLAMYVNTTTGNFTIESSDTRMWIRKVSAAPV